ncbi:uncharacterized protein LOC126603635 [Malus sylvestris]|uniref:uncharacterized protein LOC126603635 n=1 Tax=Malus sylvestris TaxID=3752 RepID=UPI0021AC2F02|nr:uncharacterized protein LOC126603635 [Malus sylvestris]
MQVDLCSLESKFDSLKNQNGKVMAGDLPPLMVKIKAFIEMYSEEEIRGILSGLDSDFSDKIDLNPSLSFHQLAVDSSLSSDCSCRPLRSHLRNFTANSVITHLSKNLFTINPGTLPACITSEKSSSMAVDATIETLSPPFHSPSFHVSSIARASYLVSQYTDLAEADRSLILEHFQQATMRWNPEVSAQPAVDNESVKDEQKSHMIVATDACLPLLASGESPIAAHVLINYELPSKKETYTRRMTTCLAGDGIVINMVIGGEVVTLKSLEESGNLVIAEMPIHISEIL